MKKTLLAAAVAALFAHAVQAAPLKLNPAPEAQEKSVVNVLFADYLAQRVGVRVETTVTDLDRNGVGEIVARFVHSGSCSADLAVCRSVVIRHDNKTWKIVFDHPVSSVEVLPGPTGVPAPIKADRVTWTWAFPTYAPTAEGVGETIAFDPAPTDVARSLAPAFGEGAAKLAAADPRYHFQTARPGLSKDSQFLVVSMKGGTACGQKTGCPVRVLRKDKDGWRPVLAASAKSEVLSGNYSREGVQDLVVDTADGFVVYGWNGQKFLVADRIEAADGGRK